MLKYEAHMTFVGSQKDRVEKYSKGFFAQHMTKGWKFSAITGDPVLGEGKWCYLSKNSDDYQKLLNEMHVLYGRLWELDLPASRMKIEEILFDTTGSAF